MKSVYGVGGVPGVGNPAAMNALLASQMFLMADLYTFTFSDASVLRFTNADGDLTVLGNVFSSTGAQLTRGQVRTIIGVEVDTLEINFMLNSTVQINSKPVAQFARQGGFDGATLELWRTFMPPTSWGDVSAGYLIQFIGRVGESEAMRTGVKLMINSDLELLNIQLPRNLYQAGCVHTLFDAGCALNRASYATAKLVQAGSTKLLLNATLVQADGYFDQGTVLFSSGVNDGLRRTVKSYVTGALTLAYPLPDVPALGDAFTAYPGCDKLMDTCTSRFSNIANFRGYPFIPVSETSY